MIGRGSAAATALEASGPYGKGNEARFTAGVVRHNRKADLPAPAYSVTATATTASTATTAATADNI